MVELAGVFGISTAECEVILEGPVEIDRRQLRIDALSAALLATRQTMKRLGAQLLDAIQATPDEIKNAAAELGYLNDDDPADISDAPDWHAQLAEQILFAREEKDEPEVNQ